MWVDPRGLIVLHMAPCVHCSTRLMQVERGRCPQVDMIFCDARNTELAIKAMGYFSTKCDRFSGAGFVFLIGMGTWLLTPFSCESWLRLGSYRVPVAENGGAVGSPLRAGLSEYGGCLTVASSACQICSLSHPCS